MPKKILPAAFIILATFLINIHTTFAQGPSPEDSFCKSKLFGSTSQDSCSSACPGGEKHCVKVQSYKKEYNPSLSEDLDCYACGSIMSCYDMGYIYPGWDCAACEADPDMQCVSAVGGGIFGFSGIPLPKDSEGYQCMDCIDRPDTCWKHFPGSTVKSGCDAVCSAKPNHECVSVGINPDDNRACFVCQKIPPPPQSCGDWGLYTQAECNKCPPKRPVCQPAMGDGFFFPAGRVIIDEKGNPCFDCVKAPKTCEEQGLKTACAADEICDPINAPNGVKCCNCRKEPKPKTCESFGYRTPPSCQCKVDEIPFSAKFDDGTGKKIDCCNCGKDKCYPDLNAIRCLEECQKKGGICQAMTTVRGEQPCYYCRWPEVKEQEPKTCQDILMFDNCRHEPCSEDETCVEVEVTLDGKKRKCAECHPKDTGPSVCETHTNSAYPNHRLANCASCFQANLACDERKIYENPDLFCAKCFSPYDQRCDPPLLEGQCISSQCADGSVCQNSGKGCHICRPKKSCADMKLPLMCSENEKCTPVIAENGDSCCRCSPKDCRDISRNPQSICDNCSYVAECVSDGAAPSGEACYKCVEKETPATAVVFCDGEKGEVRGTCPQPCSEGMECESISGKDCHSCVKKKKTCQEMDQMTHESCGKICPDPGQNCAMLDYDDFGNRCYTCKADCPETYIFGPCMTSSCPNSCDEIRNYGMTCHKCKTSTTTDGGFGSGFGETTQDGGVVPDDVSPFHCPQDSKPGKCSEQMDCFEHECLATQADPACYQCNHGECYPPNFKGVDCPKCEAKGWQCFPAGAHISSGIRGIAEHHAAITDCYKCIPREKGVCTGPSCPQTPQTGEIGQAATAGWCKEKGWYDDTSCNGQCPKKLCTVVYLDENTGKPAKGKITRSRKSMRKCYGCIKEVSWVIIIIETPRGRYILDGADGMQGFVPSQVMALAKVNNPGEALQSIEGMIPGASNSFGMLNSTISMGNMAELLKQGMDKGKKYTDECFDKDFDQEDLSQKDENGSPQPAAPSAAAPKSEFMEDASKQATTGGPILSCGSIGNEKALAIMDANGRPVEVITQGMLKDNPNVILEGLEQAQQYSDELMAAREDSMQGLLERMKSKSIDKIVTPVSHPAEGEEEVKKDIKPNDPYYPEPVEKKKKRLLGIFGSTKGTPKITIGSSLRRGDAALGAVSGAEKEELVKYQWGLHEIGYTPYDDPASAWNLVDEDSRNVIVAVIDSGIDLNHPDGPAYIWVNEDEIAGNGVDDDGNGYIDDINGWNFLDNNNDLTDREGHGTFVAGIIAAKKDNAMGIAGINPGAVIMPIKAADGEGATNSFLISRAIFYAVDNGAKVINLSLGAHVQSPLEDAALQYAYANGVFVAVASGNVGENIGDHGPASSKGAFSVGSLDIAGSKSTISNWGPNNALIAPGEEVYSLLASGTGKKIKPSLQKQGYFPRSGTSFSTPMAAATASLLLVQNPGLSNIELEDILHRSAGETYEEGWDGDSGAGILDASAALSQDVNSRLTLKINETRINKDKKGNMRSVDVFATVRGNFKSFTVELGKGKHAGKFHQVAGPFSQQANFDWLVQLTAKEHLKGSKEWIVRVKAVDQNGQEHLAQTLLEL